MSDCSKSFIEHVLDVLLDDHTIAFRVTPDHQFKVDDGILYHTSSTWLQSRCEIWFFFKHMLLQIQTLIDDNDYGSYDIHTDLAFLQALMRDHGD